MDRPAAAAYAGDGPLVRTLLARGASFGAMAKASNVESASSDEWPPLHFATVGEHPGVVAQLVGAGADPDQRSKDGRTSSEVVAAIEQRREEARQRREEQEREANERSRRTFEAFQKGFASGWEQASSPENPVNDDTFQKRMEALARQPRPAPAARESSEPSGSGDSVRTPSPGSSDASTRPQGAGTSGPDGEQASASGAAALADEPARDEQRKREEGRKEDERKREEARKKEEERQQEEARRKAEREEKERAAKEAARRAWQDYLDQLKRGIRLTAFGGGLQCPGTICVRGSWPRGVRWEGAGAGTVDVSYRATCVSSLNWITGTQHTFVDGEIWELKPRPSCAANEVRVEVTDVK